MPTCYGRPDRERAGPHLHFHLADANSPLDAEGMPYVLAETTRLGGYSTIEWFGRGEAWTAAPPLAAPFFPAPNAVVRFPPESPRFVQEHAAC